jgi:hypothetical protein
MFFHMIPESVVYVHSIACPSCGLHSSGYLQTLGDGTGVTICPRCGTSIKQRLPENSVPQIPPADFHSPVHPHVHISHYPGLYMQPKHAPRLDFADLLRVGFSPTKAFSSLYRSTNLQRALAIVVLFSIISSVASLLVTADMEQVLGYNSRDAFELAFEGFVSWMVSLLAFMIFGIVAAIVAKDVFGGRGERSATLMLTGYAYPGYVLLSIVLLMLFTTGFRGLDLTKVQDWTSDELNQAIAAGAALLVVALIGLIWLLWVTSHAVSVANDISIGEAAMSCILAAIAAGIVYLLVGMVMQMPLGLFF